MYGMHRLRVRDCVGTSGECGDHADHHHRDGRAANVPDPDHQRRPAVGHRRGRMSRMSRLSRTLGANVITASGRAVEAAGDVDVLLLDKGAVHFVAVAQETLLSMESERLRTRCWRRCRTICARR